MMSDCAESHKVTIELDYTHYTKPDGWTKIAQIICGIITIACCAPAYFSTQIYFLIVMIWQFIISIFLALVHLRWVEFNDYGKIAEFIYTVGTSLFCFAAWVAQFSDLGGFYSEELSYRYNAQIAAASFGVIYNIALVISAGFQFRDAKQAFEDVSCQIKSIA